MGGGPRRKLVTRTLWTGLGRRQRKCAERDLLCLGWGQGPEKKKLCPGPVFRTGTAAVNPITEQNATEGKK